MKNFFSELESKKTTISFGKRTKKRWKQLLIEEIIKQNRIVQKLKKNSPQTKEKNYNLFDILYNPEHKLSSSDQSSQEEMTKELTEENLLKKLKLEDTSEELTQGIYSQSELRVDNIDSFFNKKEIINLEFDLEDRSSDSSKYEDKLIQSQEIHFRERERKKSFISVYSAETRLLDLNISLDQENEKIKGLVELETESMVEVKKRRKRRKSKKKLNFLKKRKKKRKKDDINEDFDPEELGEFISDEECERRIKNEKRKKKRRNRILKSKSKFLTKKDSGQARPLSKKQSHSSSRNTNHQLKNVILTYISLL